MTDKDRIEARVWKTGRRWPKWVAAIEVNGSRLVGNEEWPSWWAHSQRSAERKAHRWARKHYVRIEQDRSEEAARANASFVRLGT